MQPNHRGSSTTTVPAATAATSKCWPRCARVRCGALRHHQHGQPKHADNLPRHGQRERAEHRRGPGDLQPDGRAEGGHRVRHLRMLGRHLPRLLQRDRRRRPGHPRGRVRAGDGPWRGRGEGDAPARRGHGVKAHRSGPLAQGHVAGISAGLNIVDNTSMYTSWEDMAIVLAGPRSGKSLCYAIPAVLSAPARAWRPRTRAISST